MTDDPTGLSADRPSTDPAQDLFGHAPFARTLASAIRGYQRSDGIVLALYGPWGSGKSTVLAYVQHELECGPEQDRPVVVPFNPWWFSAHEHLAKAFLGQLQAVLPSKHERFRAFGNKLSEFSDALGGVGDALGAVTGQGWLGSVFRGGARLVGRSPKDVPALKEALSALLLAQKKRILVVIDDIDRLSPDEVRQLFTVIKALADFPYVTYLLAFDREVATKAISEQTGLPGDRYLEKIIQVPFELPGVDRTTLRQALFSRLDAVMSPTPEGIFDSTHWTNIFHSGLDPLFTVPRDVVRLTNALSVTYPAVAGEVNPVDFIAIESLRVFLPGVYDAIRTSPEEFTGHESHHDKGDRKRDAAFHERWLNAVPDPLRASTREMVEHLFPHLEAVWSNTYYSGDLVGEWRRHLRVCAPDIFPAYFRLALPSDAIRRSEMDALLAASQEPAAFAAVLRAAALVKSANGVSKVRALLERFMDHVADDVDAAHTQTVVETLFGIGDELNLRTDRLRGEVDFGNELRVSRIAYHLLKKMDATQRCPLLLRVIQKGHAVRCSQYLLHTLVEEAEKAATGERESLVSLAEAEVLKTAWVQRVARLAAQASFIEHPSLAWLLSGWRRWGVPEEAFASWRQAAVSDEGLLKLIAAQLSETRTHSGSDYGWRVHLRVNPKSVEPYGDVQALAARVQALLDAGVVAEPYAPAAKQFVRECERMKAGKSPDAFDFDED